MLSFGSFRTILENTAAIRRKFAEEHASLVQKCYIYAKEIHNYMKLSLKPCVYLQITTVGSWITLEMDV